ncbi:ABC transporter ATP-binding protein [Bryobacter aggregatus]|uniref:ABC transporter ATP-binding protein n=1 Tax=Bryobacter aggregatus TaxID=360054 RepID=UPI0004E12377|nr:ATP-binding cassette domain-containing protein [Bryobacter aggregatus]
MPEMPVVIKDLKKSFGEQVVLDGISFEVGESESIAVLGRSGTGKSVLLKLMVGLYQPDSGSIRIEGDEIPDLSISQLNEVRKKLGFLFQGAALYDSLTVGENVAFPIGRHTKKSPEEQQARARELLAAVGMEKDLDKLPAEISGGMQKRVGLARALALDPILLLCDEPTAGLDPITSEEIGRLILDLKHKRKMSTVIVTHDIHNAKIFADRLILLNEGKLVAQGTYSEIEAIDDPFVSRFFQEDLSQCSPKQ